LSDIRFAKADGTTPLPYFIERFDPTALDSIAIWVLMDTVKGGASNQITMYWGNASAVTKSSSSSVFDTAKGFELAMEFPQGGANAQFTDQTQNAFAGKRSGQPVPKKIGSIIGQGMYHSGDGNVAIGSITSPTPQLEPASLTVSAWVKRDGYRSFYPRVVSYDDGAGVAHSYAIAENTQSNYTSLIVTDTITTQPTHVEFTRRDNPDSNGNAYIGSTSAILQDQKWTLLTGTTDAATGIMNFYFNDSLIGTLTDMGPIDYPAAPKGGDHYFNIGGYSQNTFKGTIDDVRLLRVAKDADWVKLSYLTQKEDQTIVSIPAVGVLMPGKSSRQYSLQVTPTYRNGQLFINYRSGLSRQANAHCRMYTMSGHTVLESSLDASSGLLVLNLAGKGIAPGVYILSVNVGDGHGKIVQSLKSKFSYLP
ncbi:MAG: DUF2341 domain-containing protein, partial [Chitinivibrionales bacterium]|nr:DUF2341 domain-containing protein [Chitinivibrionales bacterium]